jgi:hypothetical protein
VRNLPGVTWMLDDRNFRQKVFARLKGASAQKFWRDEFARYDARLKEKDGSHGVTTSRLQTKRKPVTKWGRALREGLAKESSTLRRSSFKRCIVCGCPAIPGENVCYTHSR